MRGQVAVGISQRLQQRHHGAAVVEEAGVIGTNSLRDSPPQGIVGKAGADASADAGELPARIPGVGVASIAEQISVGIVVERSPVSVGDLVGSIVAGLGRK